MPETLTFLTLGLLVFAAWPGQPRRATWGLRLLTLLALSPLLRYVDAVFGFAVRLWLSAWAGTLLRVAGVPVHTEGNVLVLRGQEMAVDPACMGLRMTGLTLLLAVFWLLAYERRQVRYLPTGSMLPYAGAALALTVLANLLRIVLLVLFGLGPDHPLHGSAGLVCVLVYAWLPLLGLARWLISRYGRVAEPALTGRLSVVYWLRRVAFVLLVGLLGSAFIRPVNQPYVAAGRGGYVLKPTRFGFFQYSRPGQLIYLKPLPDWYSAEHNPATCWRGQGYALRRVREVTVAGRQIYVGELRKDGQTLQTAWWFTNGRHQCIGQVAVRTRMLRGEPGFALVNVTVADPGTLLPVVRAWLGQSAAPSAVSARGSGGVGKAIAG